MNIYSRNYYSILLDCVFCKIAKGEISAKIILETEKSLAFLDAFPLAKGHALVIPKNHYEKIQDMPSEINSDLFDLVHKTISKIDKITNATLMAVHNGKASGQEIPHVHVHLIPRNTSDSAGPVHNMFKNKPTLSDSDFVEVLGKIKSL